MSASVQIKHKINGMMVEEMQRKSRPYINNKTGKDQQT